MPSRVVNRESISLGIAELYLGDSAANISSTTKVLSGTQYFGAKSEISVKVNREFKRQMEPSGDILYLMDHILTKMDISIEVIFLEIYNKTLSFAMGGSGTDTDLFGPMMTKPVYLRAELVFTYPNKINQMILIFPKVQIVTTDFDFTFQQEDAMKSPLTIRALRTTNAAWTTRPLGKSIFI